MTNHFKVAGHQGNSPFNTLSLPKKQKQYGTGKNLPQCFINNLMLFVAKLWSLWIIEHVVVVFVFIIYRSLLIHRCLCSLTMQICCKLYWVIKKNVNLISFFYITDVKEWDKQNLSSSAIPQAFYTTCRWECSSETHEFVFWYYFHKLANKQQLGVKNCLYVYVPVLSRSFLIKRLVHHHQVIIYSTLYCIKTKPNLPTGCKYHNSITKIVPYNSCTIFQVFWSHIKVYGSK